MEKTRVALFDTGFIANIHAESCARFVPNAEVAAVYSHNRDKAEDFARRYGIPAWYGRHGQAPFGGTGGRSGQIICTMRPV